MTFRGSVLDMFRNEKGELKDPDADVFRYDTIGGHAFRLCKNKWKRNNIKMPRPAT